MRKQNTKTTVPLDVVPERRTKRFPPRFRPVGRFCDLRFRYLSSPTGREGEISRPLDHMRQIPFIHSARLLSGTNFYIYRAVFQIFSPCGTLRCVLMQSIFKNCARALARTLKISNSPFCVIPFHSCLFVLVIVSFFFRIRSKYIFFSFVISCSPIQLHRELYMGKDGIFLPVFNSISLK